MGRFNSKAMQHSERKRKNKHNKCIKWEKLKINPDKTHSYRHS